MSYRVEYGTAQRQQALAIADALGDITLNTSSGGGGSGGNTSNVTSVNSSASNVVLLEANNDRRGAAVYNDSTAILYLKLGTSASLTSCTVKMFPDAYYEVPFNYRGTISGVWSAVNGAARITEIT